MTVSFLLHIILFWFVPLQDLETIRLAYIEAGRDDSKIEAFDALIENITMEDSAVLVGYRGASLALMAKVEKGIKDKTDSFKKGAEFLEYAVKSAPNNIEVRFIRFSVQENSPGIVNYKGSMEEDKSFILENFENISSPSLKEYIGDFIKQSKAFSAEEKGSLKL